MDYLSTWSVVTCITIGTTLVLLYKHLTKNFGYWESQGVPSEKAYPIIGSEYPIFKKPMHEVDMERVKKHGRIYGTYFLGGVVFNVIDPEILKLILVKDFHVFVNRQIRRTGVKMLDLGLIFAVDDDWKRIRSVVSPTFSSGKLKKMAYMVKNIANKLTQNVLLLAEKGKPIDIKSEFSKFSIDVIATCAFGINFDPFKNPDHSFIKNTRKVFDGGIKFLLSFTIISLLPNIFENIKELTLKVSGMGFFFDAAKEVIEKRRNQINQTNVDFLQLMIDAKDEKPDESLKIELNEKKNLENKPPRTKTLDEDEIVAQCGTFLFGGSDTVASAISYVAYNLARHMDVQEKLLREIDETWDKYGDIDYDIVNKLPYLNAVVSETLRLQSVTIRMMRQAKEDYLIPNTTIVIPKNTIISIPVYVLHHDPEFFPDPDKFDPDRFLPENKDKILPYTYMPFSDGPRNCVAMRFALMEIKFCLAYFLRYVKLLPTEETMKPLKFNDGTGALQTKEVIIRPEKRRSLDIN